MAKRTIFARVGNSKICVKCGVSKPRSDFPLQRGIERARCKPCHTKDAVEYAKRNRDKVRTYHAEWRSRNKDKVSAYGKKTYGNMSEAQRAKILVYRKRRHLERKYGITPEIWQEMHDRQGGVCAICRVPGRTGKHDKLAVDHCHVTGRVRGLLCTPCNVSIGILGETPEQWEVVMQYLRGTNAQAEAANQAPTLAPPDMGE